MTEPCVVGDIFLEKDKYRKDLRGPLHVVFVVKSNEHRVKKDTAICIERGEVTKIAVDRLTNPARFEKSFPLEAA